MLVVDDEEPILFAMREYFEAKGYDVDAASTAADADALLAVNDYAIVIADLRLTPQGGREGLDLAASVKKRQPQTRVLLLTAYGSPETEAEARGLQVDAVLHKPRPLAQIARIVADLVASPS